MVEHSPGVFKALGSYPILRKKDKDNTSILVH